MTRAVRKTDISEAVDRYRNLMGHRHLDVGPGTGYFIERAAPPAGTEITLIDANPRVLAYCSRRLAGMHPTTVEADVLKPLPIDGRFDSAALSFILHCLPGPQPHKAVAVPNVAALLEPDGVLFGGTVLGLTSKHTRPARTFLRAVNRQGAFDNREDTAEGLRAILGESVEEVTVDVVGSTALFTARRARQHASS